MASVIGFLVGAMIVSLNFGVRRNALMRYMNALEIQESWKSFDLSDPKHFSYMIHVGRSA
jgi:hypothetical protein